MFVCRACLRSLAGTVAAPVEPRLLRPLRKTTGLGCGRRMLWTTTQAQADVSGAWATPRPPRAPPPTASKSERRRVDTEDEDLEIGASRKGGDAKKLEWAVKKQLKYLRDPWHIAQHVTKALDRGSFDEALCMTRIASRDAKVEVSWNHLIDYLMKNGRLNAAVKLYNEMKKRAQIPNAKTFTIIFRGCAHSLHPKLAVSEATRLYNFLLGQGAVKPNTIHMNAVLEVCARAGDLDSMFTVLATANESLRAPDAFTYTIVLNALRQDMVRTGNARGLVDKEVERDMQKTIQRARAIWGDVLARWQSAKMLLDEELVCAMGRVLCSGDYHDRDSVLSLLEQTMNIPRLDKPAEKLAATSGAGTSAQVSTNSEGDDVTANSPAFEEAAGLPSTGMSAKGRRDLAASRAGQPALRPKPDCPTLSLVLTALAGTRKTSHAARYWDYFTRILRITPDTNNYFCYLNALRVGHASGQTAELVARMPGDMVNHVTFRIAFGVCIRDNLNKDAFPNACKIFDVMTWRLRYPDALAMRLFLHVARGSTRHCYEQAETDPEAAKRAHGKQIVTAVDRMWEPFRILLTSFSYPHKQARSPESELEMKRGDMQEAMATARRIIAAIDRVVQDEMVERRILRVLRARRVIMQRLVERYIAKLYPDGPKGETFQKDAQELEFLQEDFLKDFVPKTKR